MRPILSQGDDQFLKEVEVIRRRSLITVAVVTVAVVVFVAVGWLRLEGLVSSSPHEPETTRLILFVRASLMLFLSTVLAIAVGVLVLIMAYARQTRKLLEVIARLKASRQPDVDVR
jgi:hypothetical protein